jgi:hypothetical protein
MVTAIIFGVFVVINGWFIIFVHIPRLIKRQLTTTWACIGIHLGVFGFCCVFLGEALHTLFE